MLLRNRVLLVFFIVISLALFVSLKSFMVGRSVERATATLVEKRIHQLQLIADLRARFVEQERAFYEYYATAFVPDTTLDIANSSAIIQQNIDSLYAIDPKTQHLDEIALYHTQFDQFATEIGGALAGSERDWDMARTVLSRMSVLGSEQLYPLLESLSQDLQKQAESAGQIAQSQVRNTVTMVWFFSVLIVLISALVALVFIRYIKNAAVRRRLAKFVENNPHAVLSIDYKGRVVYHNQASASMVKEYFPQGVVDDLLPKDIFQQIRKLRDSAENNLEWEYDWRGLHLLGSLSLVNELAQYDFHIRDITARRQAEFKLNHLAFHDDLTDLPNRRLLGEKLSGVKHEASCSALLMLIRPDRFQLITSSSGYEFGDLLIIQTAKRILSALKASEIDIHLFRLDAAQFALLGCFEDEIIAETYAEKINQILVKAFAQPIGVNEQQIFLTMSIGSVIRESAQAIPEAMIRDADAALRVSILQGGDC